MIIYMEKTLQYIVALDATKMQWVQDLIMSGEQKNAGGDNNYLLINPIRMPEQP